MSDSDINTSNVNLFNPYKSTDILWLIILFRFMDEATDTQSLITCQSYIVGKKSY